MNLKQRYIHTQIVKSHILQFIPINGPLLLKTNALLCNCGSDTTLLSKYSAKRLNLEDMIVNNNSHKSFFKAR